ncbi:MAG: lipase secretion chaperone [Pseudomarimonas sp.]
MNPLRRRIAAGLGIACVVGSVVLLMQQDRVPPPALEEQARTDQPINSLPASETPVAAMTTVTAASAQQAADQALITRWQASSLRGTEVDGVIRFSADGRLIRDYGLRQLIEHFLSLTGEFSDADIRRLLALHVQSKHGDAATDAVLATFDQYLAMRNELASIPANGDLGERFAAIRSIRERWFGADSEAMFGSEHAQVAQTLERQAIAKDTTLTLEEREQRLAEWDAARPPIQRAAEANALSAQLAEQQTEQMEALQIDANARFAERSEVWGEDAAHRLAALDQARQQWDQRLIDYSRARDRIRNDPSLNSAQRQMAIDALRRTAFSADEQVRIESLEAIEQLPGGG